MKWIIGILLLAVAVGAVVFFYYAPVRADAQMNVVIAHDAYDVSHEAKKVHDTLRVADLHADSLLWMRDPSKRHSRGHVDLPRLREGSVRLQVFSAVTKTPSGLNYDKNDAGSDDITLLAIAQRWPVKSWKSLAERALFQAARLDKLERNSAGQFIFAKTADDLAGALDAGLIAGVYAIEGAHPLEGDIANIDRLYDAGLRVMGLQHFFDNELGGSLHGQSGLGLTRFGREAVNHAIAKGMIIDVAHSSEATVRDVLQIAETPVIVSHTGFKGHCDSHRNISDELMISIAEKGGLVGVGYWDGAVCNPSLDAIASAIIYAINLIGVDHVALGSDFDGTVTTPIDASELSALTAALLAAKVDETDIRKIMGENAIQFFLENLPAD